MFFVQENFDVSGVPCWTLMEREHAGCAGASSASLAFGFEEGRGSVLTQFFATQYPFSPSETCQVRVVRFYVIYPASSASASAGPRLQASSGSECSPPDLHRNSGSECFPPDLHRKLRIRVFPAGSPPQAQDQSVSSRISTESSGS